MSAFSEEKCARTILPDCFCSREIGATAEKASKNIGDFVAHHSERTKGLTTLTARDWAAIARFRGWRPNETPDITRLPSVFPDFLNATARRLGHKIIKQSTGLTRAEAAARIPHIVSRLIRNDDGTFALNPLYSQQEQSILDCFLSHIVARSAFNGERLYLDFSATLKSNGLISKDELRTLATIRHFVILYASVVMHRCAIVIDESLTVLLQTFAHPAARIQVDCPIPITTGIASIPAINLSSAIFSTDLSSSQYCDPSLLTIRSPWDFPLELTSGGRIKRLE